METTETAATTATTAATAATATTDETVNTAAVDQTIDGAAAQPTIDTSAYDNAILNEPSLGKRCTPLVTILDFKPAFKKEGNAFYGWEFKLRLEETVPDDAGGELPVGFEIPFLKVFTVPNPSSGKDEKTINRICAAYICAFNGIVQDLKNDPKLDKAKAALQALPPIKRTPLPNDTDETHYKQWVNTVVRATLKPGKPDNSGRPQIDLQGMAAALGSGGSVPY